MNPTFFESLLIRVLFTNSEAQDKVLPYLDARVFSSETRQKLVKEIIRFYEKYNKFPSSSEMQLFSTADVFEEVKSSLAIDTKEYSDEFILDEVETFFSDKLYFQALLDGKKALDDGDTLKMTQAYSDMQEALAFSFDNDLGLSLKDDWERLYEIHHNKEYFLKTGVELLDNMMGGGLPSMAITLFLAGTNVGKTLIQCALATNMLLQNKNVLYISMEEQEDILSKRFQGNLFDIEIDNIKFMTKDKFKEVYEKAISRFTGNLEIVGWPSGSKNANHIRLLVKEYEMKKGFKPDIIFVDYIGCMVPIRLGKTYDSNTELMNITDEVRSVGVELGIPMVSGLQLNRGGIDSSDVGLGDTAASIGSTFKADFIFGVTAPPELAEEGMYSIKVLKSRSSDKSKLSKGLLGVYPAKMRIYDIEDESEDKIKEEKVESAVDIMSKVSAKSRKTRRSKLIEDE
jgi:archaellum biogenesis ATPase FlaH